MIRYTSKRTRRAQKAIAKVNSLAAHQLMACVTTAVFSRATFTTLIPAMMLNLITQQIATAVLSDKRRIAARSGVQKGRKTLTAAETMFTTYINRYPQKKY